MQRVESPARPDWQAKLEEIGLTYHSAGAEPETGAGGGLWWHEASHWRLSTAEVDALDDATVELHARCLDAVDHLVNREPDLLREAFGLPDWFADYVRRSWQRQDPALMGRMDLAFDDATGAIKLLEYNADTPTLAIETAVAQWVWLQATHPGADQFNSLHEKLLTRFAALAPLTAGRPMHFAAFADSAEEWAHSTYYRDLASQAGIETISVDLGQIGWNREAFMDEAGFAQTPPNRGAWTPAGECHAATAVRGKRLNILGALLSTVALFTAKLWTNTTAELFAGFLGLLLKQVGKPLTIILDNASVHTAKVIAPLMEQLKKRA